MALAPSWTTGQGQLSLAGAACWSESGLPGIQAAPCQLGPCSILHQQGRTGAGTRSRAEARAREAAQNVLVLGSLALPDQRWLRENLHVTLAPYLCVLSRILFYCLRSEVPRYQRMRVRGPVAAGAGGGRGDAAHVHPRGGRDHGGAGGANSVGGVTGPEGPPLLPEPGRPAYRMSWAQMRKRTFAEDVLACPCGGRKRFLCFVFDPEALAAMARSLGIGGRSEEPGT